MLLNSFHRFLELALELRSKIWGYAIAIHVQDIANSLSPCTENSWAERRRHILVGGTSRELNPALHFFILDLHRGQNLFLVKDEFKTFISCLPISTVSYATRLCAIEFCQLLVSHIRFIYKTHEPWGTPTEDAQPILPGNSEILHRPTTLTVETGCFESVEHFVGMVSRFFGDSLHHLVLDQGVSTAMSFDRTHWPSSCIMPKEIGATLVKVSEGDPALVWMTGDQKVYISTDFWQTKDCVPSRLAIHLHKLYELFTVSKERLPKLEYLEVRLDIQGMDDTESKFLMKYEREVGVLTVISSTGDDLHWPMRGINVYVDI